MRKFAALLIAVSVFISSFIPFAYADGYDTRAPEPGILTSDLSGMAEVQPLEYEFEPATSEWSKKIGNVKPAVFSEVKYDLADNVILVNPDVTRKLASAGQMIAGSTIQKLKPNKIVAQGGYIPVSVLNAAAAQKRKAIQPGSICVDEQSGTAFKVVSPISDSEYTAPFKDTYAVIQPELHEVIKDFNIKDDTITLTRGNISGFAQNVENSMVVQNPAQPMAFGDSLKSFKYLGNDPMINLKFTDTTLKAYTGGGSEINVKLSGGLGIDNVQLVGKYSGFGGYKVGLTMDQECYLVVEVQADIKEEIRIPILGFEVPFGIGKVAGGLFVIVNLDGTIRLEIEAREYTKDFIGISGSTAFYVPVSFKPGFSIERFETDGDVDIAGKINGSIRAGALLQIEIFGLDLVGAGAFLGAGLNVVIDGKNLDIDVYGILEAYVALLGKHFRLINYRPTILEKKQRNTGGYRVTIKEAFVKPGLVGGTIEAQTNDPNDDNGYVPAQDLEYRVKIVPEGVDIDSDSDQIRYYPAEDANGTPVYALTNTEGLFYQPDVVCTTTDKVIIEFKAKENSNESENVKENLYECDPVVPWLPFKKITVTQADYFSEFATGQVEPVKTIWWDAPPSTPEDERTKMTYYSDGLVGLSLDTGGMARTKTDQYGHFDTRIPLLIESSGSNQLAPQAKIIPNIIDIRPETKITGTIDTGTIDTGTDSVKGATFSCYCPCTPTVSLEFVRVVDEVGGSYKRLNEGAKVIDQMAYDDRIYIVNQNGTQTLKDGQIKYQPYGYSTQDLFTKGSFYWDQVFGSNPGVELAYRKRDDAPVGFYPEAFDPILSAELDENGNPNGTTLLANRVTTEWVWQPHSNPVTITSADHATLSTKGGTFQVTATGVSPLAFSIKDAPSGIAIDKGSGLITIPVGMTHGNYIFTIHAEQNEGNNAYKLATEPPVYKEDASPPDEQLFTLTIADEEVATPEPSTPTPDPSTPTPEPSTPTPEPSTPTPQPSTPTPEPPTPTPEPSASATPPSRPTPTPEPLVAPVIDEGASYEFTKLVGAGDLVIPIEATGSRPITFSLIVTNTRQKIPQQVAIDAETGILTIKDGIPQGQYFFTIKATNDAGSDTQDCRLNVTSITPTRPSLPPAHLSWDGSFKDQFSMPLAPMPSAQPLNPEVPSYPNIKAPPNAFTIRNDHEADLYSKLQLTTNGAAYVKWEALVYVSIEGKTSTYILFDDSPLNDHHLTPFDVDELDEVKNKFKEQLSDYNRNDLPWEDLTDIMDGSAGVTVNPLEMNMTYLDYGSLLDEMSAQKGGSFQVELGGSHGTIVTGKYFTGLQNNKNATLSFQQDGATVTFKSKDIGSASEWDLFDFGYAGKAPHEAEMLSNIESGQQSYTYSFKHHGDLPGMAAFGITTGIAEGTKVNVYKYDAASDQFSLVAKDLNVGQNGVLTYMNNSMSEYLITTQTIENAEVLAVSGSQSDRGTNSLWLAFAGAAVVLLGAAALYILYRKRHAINPR